MHNGKVLPCQRGVFGRVAGVGIQEVTPLGYAHFIQ